VKSTYTPAYQKLLAELTRLRRGAGLTQSDVAERMGKPQSFVSKVESGERRLDVVEFIELAEAIGFDPASVMASLKH